MTYDHRDDESIQALHKTAVSTHISNGIEDELDILSICSTCVMAIDFFLSGFVFRDELRLNIFRGWIVFVRARVFTKAEYQWRAFDFVFE